MEALKNLFNENFVKNFASCIKKYSSSFDEELYLCLVLKHLETLELKARMRLISSKIRSCLKADYGESCEILKLVKEDFFKEKTTSLQAMVLADFVEVYGLEHFDVSMNALETFTIDSSSEFAVREFILKDEQKAMDYFYKWAKNSNEHIRRLASEGCRPRLPWAIALPSFKKDPTLIFSILDELKNDESSYVRRSVANNLNDISKDNPILVLSFIEKNIGSNKQCDSLLKHAARTLLKKGDVKTLELFGYRKIDALILNDFILDSKVCIGEHLNFSFELENKTTLGLLRVEYEIDFQMANDKRSKKIYMISQSEVKANKKLINKKHSFKMITTRKYYLGIHFITLIVNGIKIQTKEFLLTKP
ncbi:DNA alkylation repair protein [Poseidonibacter ostreae]|uniref:DNA alkylation repair protein n=1 Tax=Poseidonibacter ostreae TaxID=2654171 RepID=UPI001264B436|nr:DNA alkylation repair protein [Poseidonibacter ostreae]KAB7888336.1 DNA alkylation repair protein [Poseidonibacter ostreae]